MLRSLVLLLLLVMSASRLLAQASPAHPPAASSQMLAQPPTEPKVYLVADEMPSFPGGAAAFQQFLKAKIKYPEEALQRNLSGKVHVSFVVDEEGRILNSQIVRGLGGGLNEEALRLVRIMPWWTPGRVNGQPVRVACTLPIEFKTLN